MQDTLFDIEPEPDGPLLPMPAPPPIRPRVPVRDLPVGMREEVFARDGWICQSCGVLCAPTKSVTASRGRWATIDHVVPMSRGGWDDPVNLQTLCQRCNEVKGDRIIDYRWDVNLRLALDLEREKRGLLGNAPRLTASRNPRNNEKLSVVFTCRVTEAEAAVLRARYGTGTYAARAGVDRLLYAG